MKFIIYYDLFLISRGSKRLNEKVPCVQKKFKQIKNVINKSNSKS